MEWVWTIYRPYIEKMFSREGIDGPSDEQLEQRFLEILGGSSVTVLVQEPWQNSVRFKTLARYDPSDMFDLLNDPEGFLLERFGGGKFKLNFHQGWHFVATQNFKPEGEPRWQSLPELEINYDQIKETR